MVKRAGAFFAGIGTTFVVLAVGFSGGLLIADSALKEPAGYQTRAAKDPLTPVRVILPHSAEAAQEPQHQATLPPEPQPQPAIQPAKSAQSPVEAQVENSHTTKLEAAREGKRRYAERKAKRQAEARARLQREQQRRWRDDAPIMAFGGDSSPRFGGGFFGN